MPSVLLTDHDSRIQQSTSMKPTQDQSPMNPDRFRHSLRRGYCTDAAQDGHDAVQVAHQTATTSTTSKPASPKQTDSTPPRTPKPNL